MLPLRLNAVATIGPPTSGMALQSMFGIFVPEVKGAVATGGREGAVLRVEGDCVDGVDFGHVPVVTVVDTVAFE